MEIIFIRHAQTQQNLDQIAYDNYNSNEYYPITERGKIQASLAGDWLKKFGKFDAVYSSPRHRCIQTLEQITKKIKYKGDIIIDQLLLEGKAGDMNGIHIKEIEKLCKQNKKLAKLDKELKHEINPFKKVKINKKINIEHTKMFNLEEDDLIFGNNFNKFLNKLKKQKHKRVLICAHGGTLYGMMMNLTNISYYTHDINLNKNDDQLIERKNCMCFGCVLEDNAYKVIFGFTNEFLKPMEKCKIGTK